MAQDVILRPGRVQDTDVRLRFGPTPAQDVFLAPRDLLEVEPYPPPSVTAAIPLPVRRVAAIVQVQLPTTTGYVDFQFVGGGTCRGAIFWFSKATTNGTAVDDAVMGYGATDGVSNVSCVTSSAHGLTTTAAYRYATTDTCLSGMLPVGSQRGVAVFNSFITDGVRLEITNAFDEPHLVNCLLLFGESTKVAVGVADTSSGAAPVTTDFEPNIVNIFGTRLFVDSNIYSGAAFSNGWAANQGGTVAQGSMNWGMSDGVGTSDPYMRIETTNIARDLDGPTVNGAQSVGSFNSSGFTVSQVGGSGFASLYVAIRVDARVNWTAYSTRTVTGPFSYTQPGFRPDAVVGYLSKIRTVGTNNETSLAGAWGAFGFAEDGREYSVAIATEDGATTSNTQSLVSSYFYDMPAHDGSQGAGTGILAELASMDATGFTVNWNVVDTGNFRVFGGLSIGRGPYAQGTIAATAPTATTAIGTQRVVQSGYPAADFNGSGQSLTPEIENPPVGNDMTIAFWVWFDAPTTARSVMGAWKAASVLDPPERVWRLRTDTNGNLNFDWHDLDVGQLTVTHPTVLVTNRGYHVAVVVDGANDQIRVYVDNVEQILNSPVVYNTQPTQFLVGTVIGTILGNYFDGRIARLRFWTRSLSSSEVTALYNGGQGVTYPQLTLIAGMSTNLYSSWELDQYVASGYQLPRLDSHTSGNALVGGTGWSQGPGKRTAAATATTAISSQVVHQVQQLAIDFRNNNDYLRSIDDSWSVDSSGQRVVTIACWVYPNTVDTLVIGQWGPSDSDQQFSIQWTGLSFQGIAHDSGLSLFSVESNVLSGGGQWYHVVFAIDLDLEKLFLWVDDVSYSGPGPLDLPNVSGSSTSFFYTGVDIAGPRYGDYRVQQIQRWNTALTPTDVTLLYNAGKGVSYPNLPAGDFLAASITHEVTGHTYAPGNRPVVRPNIVDPGLGDLYDQTNTPSGLGHGFMPAASRATASISAKRVHQTTAFAVSAKRATGALDADLLHVTALAVSATSATADVTSQIIHQTALALLAGASLTAIDVDVTSGIGADIDATASTATADANAQVVHQTTDGSVSASRATATVTAKRVIQTSVAVQASRATAAVASKLVHQTTDGAVQASTATVDIDATRIHTQATISATAQTATTALAAQVVHQTTDGSVQAPNATAALSVRRVVQATIGAQASRATAAVQSKLVHQTSTAVQASRATASTSAKLVRQTTLALAAARATSALATQVVHQTTDGSVAASNATTSIAVTVAASNAATITATASRATAATSAQVVHQTTDGAVQASAASAVVSAKVVHQATIGAQAARATASVSAKLVHQTTDGSVQASPATAALSAKLVHQTATAVSASRATAAISAEIVGSISTTLAVQAQRATAASTAQLIHQTTDGSVQAPTATTVIAAKRVVQASVACSASRATCAINAQKKRTATLAVSASRATAAVISKLIHQTNTSVQASTATTVIVVTYAAGRIVCSAQRATCAVVAQVIHRATVAPVAAPAHTALLTQLIHQTSAAVQAQRASAHLTGQFVYSATLHAACARATAHLTGQRVPQTSLAVHAAVAHAHALAQRIHQANIDAAAQTAWTVIVGGQGFLIALAVQAQRARASLAVQVVHQTDLALDMNAVRVRILDYAIIWYTPVPILRPIPEGVELEVARGAVVLRPIPESLVLDVAPGAATIFLDMPKSLP